MSFGIQPISSVGYSLVNETLDGTCGGLIERSIFSGEGGVSRIYTSLGIKIFKKLSIGFEAEYSFGNIENSITNQIAGISLSTKYKEFNYC